MNGNREFKIGPNESKYWYKNGQYHREDGPAIERADGTKEWYLNGKPHREDGPAVEYANGTKLWYLNGKHHREDGPAIERVDGTKAWYLNDKLIKTKFNDFSSPTFQKRWQKLLELERIRQVMED